MKMNDLANYGSCPSGKTIIIAALLALLAGLIIIFFMFAGPSCIEADTPIYGDGKLTTILSNSGDNQKTWVQYKIYRREGFSCEQIGDIQQFTYPTELRKGNTLSTCDVMLTPGNYKVFIYIYPYEGQDHPNRIAGFIKDIKVRSI